MMQFTDLVKQPAPDQKIWRYMNFEKFVSLIHYRALFFAQAKHFEDPYEGYYSGLLDYSPQSDLHIAMKRFYNHPMNPASYCVINCWHMNSYQSQAMWRLYATSNAGLAIQSTVEALTDSIDFGEVGSILTGMVDYRKADDPLPGDPDGLPFEYHYFFKREEYDYEREFRILCHCADIEQANVNGGIHLPVNLENMIKVIYVAPKSPPWIRALLQGILWEQFNLDIEVTQSDLTKRPFE